MWMKERASGRASFFRTLIYLIDIYIDIDAGHTGICLSFLSAPRIACVFVAAETPVPLPFVLFSCGFGAQEGRARFVR